MSFPQLPLSAATRAALETMDIVEPTPIQARSLPLLFAGKDVIGQARTGSGKTLAFALPMVEKVDPKLRAVQAIVLVPTRELAQQVGQVVEAVSHERGIRTALVFGGRSAFGQIAELRAGAQIVVGAPGRVLDLLRQGALRPERVHYFVLDEADEMLDQGFAPDVERILAFMPKERQTVLFSATVPDWVSQTANKYLRNPELVAIDTRPEDVPKIEHVIYDVPEGHKLGVLRVLLEGREDGSVLVFGRTKHGVKKLAKQLVALGYPAAALQGNLSQNARDAVMADFRSRRVPILLATNVAARGLDVEHIELVINYELPETTELLTHRVGRTGRMGREGDAVTLLSPTDEPKWRQLSRQLNGRIPRKAWKGELPATPEAVHAIPLYDARPPRRAAGQASRPAKAPNEPTGSRQAQRPASRQSEHPRRQAPGMGAPRQQSDQPRWQEAPGQGRANGTPWQQHDSYNGRRQPSSGNPRSQDRRFQPARPAAQPPKTGLTGRSWQEDHALLEAEDAHGAPTLGETPVDASTQAPGDGRQRRRNRRRGGNGKSEAAA